MVEFMEVEGSSEGIECPWDGGSYICHLWRSLSFLMISFCYRNVVTRLLQWVWKSRQPFKF